MTSQSFIVKKMSTFPNETIHITLKYAMHLHGIEIKCCPS
jgi:hypothetical protein